MLLAHKIRLDPTNTQRTFFTQCVGTARFAYSWALTEWQSQYTAGENPTEIALRQLLNGIKGTEFPWLRDVPKTVPQQAVKTLAGVSYLWQRWGCGEGVSGGKDGEMRAERVGARV